jgi:DoxX-like protein
MTTEAPRPRPTSKAMVWTGWVLSVLPALLLLFSGTMKLLNPPELAKNFEHLGYPASLALVLGIVEVGSTLTYLFPPTAVLGAILLTGYLGGAVATHARLQEMQFITPVILGIVVWLGLFLRDGRVRSLLPIRR